MVRQQKLRATASDPTRLIRFRRVAGVWTFYGIILIWNNSSGAVSISDCTGFFLSLFGV